MKTVSKLDQAKDADSFLPKEKKPTIDLKGSVFTLTVLRLLTNQLDGIEKGLKERLAQGPRFFEDAPVVIDVEKLKEQSLDVDFARLATLLRELRLIPVGVRHGNQSHQKEAVGAGLALMKGGAMRDLSTPAKPALATQDEVEKPSKSTHAPPPQHVSSITTKVVHQPIRSGQQIYAKKGDLIVLAAVNAGAELVADGNIHIYAPLRGRALAGVQGDTSARIFCQSMEAELVSVAGHYQVFEDDLPANLHHNPAQIFLQGDELKIELLA